MKEEPYLVRLFHFMFPMMEFAFIDLIKEKIQQRKENKKRWPKAKNKTN